LVNTPTMPALELLLRSWISVCRAYERRVCGDHPWYYHERAHTGFLAAAAWKAHGVALEEWRTEKRSTRGDRREGRSDLWIQLDKVCAHIEAKHMWCLLGSAVDRAAERVGTRLKRARHDASDIICGPGEQRLGVLFVAPVVRRVNIEEGPARLRGWLTELKRRQFNFAWTMNRECRRTGGRDRVVLGVALVIGRARRPV
jgi:hypothetical protein